MSQELELRLMRTLLLLLQLLIPLLLPLLEFLLMLLQSLSLLPRPHEMHWKYLQPLLKLLLGRGVKGQEAVEEEEEEGLMRQQPMHYCP
jgi:hypothetical protein